VTRWRARPGGGREVWRRPAVWRRPGGWRLLAGSGDPRGLAMAGIWSAGPIENGVPGRPGTDAGAAPTASSGSTGNIEPSRTGDLPLSPTVDIPPVPVQGAKGDSR